MAKLFNQLRPDATHGEKRVYDLLARLSDDYWVWPELSVGEQYPDFVVAHPRLGIAVLEVKDWVEVCEADASSVLVRTRDGAQRREHNPLQATRAKAIAVASKLEARPKLLHTGGPFQGKLKLAWTYAVVFPNLTRMWIYTLGDVFEPSYLVADDDLHPSRFEDRMRGLAWRFPAQLEPGDMDEVRAALQPQLIIRDSRTGGEVGIADMRQEQVAKEGLFAAKGNELDEEVTPEGKRIAVKQLGVRLVRGVAGSGKTLVLALRARFLAEAYPDWQILVTTFNKALAEDLAARLAGHSDRITVQHFHALCAQMLGSIGVWQGGPVGDSMGLLANLLPREFPAVNQWDAAFLASEIAWIKDCGIRSEEDYLQIARAGRGERLSRAERSQLYRIYQRYEERLRDRRRFDWQDVPLLVQRAIENGDLTPPAYHAILVDEAQDFAPTWFDVLRHLLLPDQPSMFLAADSTQRIYRSFSWRAMGLHVVGRTRILPRSYRSTYEIMRAAAVLVEDNPDLKATLADEEEEPLRSELDPAWMRHGPQPELRRFNSRPDEVSYLARRINSLIAEGYAPGDIVVLHARAFGPEQYRSALRQAGVAQISLDPAAVGRRDVVQFATIHSVKGLEYRVVFIVQAQLLFESDRPIPFSERAKFTADQLRLLYVAMTRARDLLTISYQSRLPKELGILEEHLRLAEMDADDFSYDRF